MSESVCVGQRDRGMRQKDIYTAINSRFLFHPQEKIIHIFICSLCVNENRSENLKYPPRTVCYSKIIRSKHLSSLCRIIKLT